MRRSLLCLAVITLAALLAVRFGMSSPDSDRADAQEPPVAAIPARAVIPNPLTVPSSAEVPVLVDFIKRVRQARPETEEEQLEYDQKSAIAIRTACERILELDPNEASEARRFARRELLLFEVEDLAKDETVDEEDRKRIAAETVALVKASGLIASDVEFATTVATAFEDFAPAAEAKALYQAVLGEMSRISIKSEETDVGDALKTVFCVGFSSPDIERALAKCMARCTINGHKVDDSIFDFDKRIRSALL